jgi:hypothetical protein
MSEGRAVLLATVGGEPDLLPPVAEAAYVRGAKIINEAMGRCHLPWEVLAGVGWIESGHGTAGGLWLTESGDMSQPMFGPASSATDTDGGEIDESPSIDRGVGPLQFMPMLWVVNGVDSNGDGRRDPQNIDDAALSLGTFLCAGEVDLAADNALRYALGRFNGVDGYAERVILAADFYRAHPTELESGPSIEPVIVLDSATSSASASPTAVPSPSESAATPTATRTPAGPSPTKSSKPTPTKPNPTTPTATISATPTSTVTPVPSPSMSSTASPTP